MNTPAAPRPRRLVRFLVFGAVGMLLAGCAEPPATPDWTPPPWNDRPGTRLAATTVDDTTDLNDLGFVNRRIRNDAIGYQARYVLIPGADQFNQRVDQWIRQPLTGATFVPEAFPVGSGLADRGCAEGSLGWDANRVLTDPATGPVNGTGTALTCDIVAAFGTTVGVGMRAVSGTNGEADSDEMTTLYVDLATDTIIDSVDLWTPEAPAQLWTSAVEQLRRQAGGLSTAPIEAPADDQIALAAQAFTNPRGQSDGSAVLVLPAGISAPELTGLGIEQTTEPVEVSVEAAVLTEWQSPAAAALSSQQGEPFAGMPEWSPTLPIDCSLHSCVALTYDDGPGQLTPQLLETLKARQAGATFFELCTNVKANPEITKQVGASGYELASHTMTHPQLTSLSAEKVDAEVNGCANMIAGLTGKPVTLFRPPYGAVNAEVISAAGKPAIFWSIDTNDWQRPGVAALIERSVPTATPGDIILFHDIHPDSVAAAGQVVDGLKDRGLTPVSVTQLFNGSVPAGLVIKK
ncbi:MAG: polysaccharide deacetylase family protein [Propionibacterium sp.]|nr:polysaccharide deacetylase family protein [Propionibacterium sp.]